jgi:hypothetical protein
VFSIFSYFFRPHLLTAAVAEEEKKLETEGHGAQDQSELDQPQAPPAPLTEPPPRPGREPVVDCQARSPDPAEALRPGWPRPRPEDNPRDPEPRLRRDPRPRAPTSPPPKTGRNRQHRRSRRSQ